MDHNTTPAVDNGNNRHDHDRVQGHPARPHHDASSQDPAPAPAPAPSTGARPSMSTNPPSHSGHKRSLSGNIMRTLNFLRTSSEDARPSLEDVASDPPHRDTDNAPPAAPAPPVTDMLVSPDPESAFALAHRAAKQRKRKGSLRKTALLGTGRLKAEGRERRNSLLQRPKHDEELLLLLQPSAPHPTTQPRSSSDGLFATPDASGPAPPPTTTTTTTVQELLPKLSLDTVRSVASLSAPPNTVAPALSSPIISPTSQSYASTTDDDEGLTLPTSALKRPPMAGAGSYFPPHLPVKRRRSSDKQPRSPLSAIPINAYGSDEDYDYSETEWWGWVVLVVTWIVFVVGMGSCFDVWSWAWDVGETPYAPPELEDDPTLPIVGYYPALIILSAVMAWVWVVVAWVGMKYFKHAKMAGEDL